MVNFPDTHWPFQNEVEGRPRKLITPDKVKPFNYMAYDNPTIHAYTTALYNCMQRLDECVGELMARLKGSGKERNTLVFFLSDHGDEMARGKFDIYEAGTKVPFMPTVLDVAGVPVPKNLSGKSLAPLFKNPGMDFRQYLFTEKNIDEMDLYYPRRAVRDKKYKLIYSLIDGPDRVAEHYMSVNRKPNSPLGGSPSVKEMETMTPQVKRIYSSWLNPGKIQLYDLENDPWEFNDLSKNPKYNKVKDRLFKALSKWQKDTDDPLRFPDKVKMLTQENDTIKTSKNMQWQYPHYLYGQ